MSDRLYPALLRGAYSQGYFPMPDPESGEILWYRPDPRAVIPLDGFHCSRSLARVLRRGTFTVSFDRAFVDVMRACATREETWITEEFIEVYSAMHGSGMAHSVEVWHDGELAGGTYGVSIGGAFFAESMFHTKRDASKVALFHLVEHLNARGFRLLEVQFLTPHLARLGAVEITDRQYQKQLREAIGKRVSF